MGKFIDMTGWVMKEHGVPDSKLTVLYLVSKKGENPKKWHCKCECGNEFDATGTLIRNGNTKSCGCLIMETARINGGYTNLVGKKFGKLTVIEQSSSKKSNNGRSQMQWICKCDCGNYTTVTTSHLKSGHTRSCGCLQHEHSAVFKEEIGNRYGKLTVVQYIGNNKEGNALWLCKCDCGGEKITTGKSLRNGLCVSCGCLKSKGEEKIGKILTDNNIKFLKEYSFSNCLNPETGTRLYFDFYLPDYNILIEYNGEQHYKEINRGYYNNKTLKD